MNHTRIFLGDYAEEPNAFCIQTNPLAPDTNRLITPWARSSEPGYRLGGNKFDLETWNPDYFQRLHAFMQLAEGYDIIVEAVLFFAGYQYVNSPLLPINNINATSELAESWQYTSLENGSILEYQEQYARRLVRELNRYDNLILNVCNEPWFSAQAHPGFSSPPRQEVKKWIQRVSEWIKKTESDLPNQHLISVDYTNKGERIPKDELNSYFKHITVFNHHYDRDAESISFNRDYRDLIFSFNETGLMPAITPQYRIQGWKYLFCGGALYNNLDYTYQVGAEDGSGFTVFTCDGYSGCTDQSVKYQLAALLRFMNTLPLERMRFDPTVIQLPEGDDQVFVLVSPGERYALYFTGCGTPKIKLALPAGEYNVEWLNPADLRQIWTRRIRVTGGGSEFIGPGYDGDMLLDVRRMDAD